jgi:hypothetical protein
MVKFASAENDENGVIATDFAWNTDAKADAFTLKNYQVLGSSMGGTSFNLLYPVSPCPDQE